MRPHIESITCDLALIISAPKGSEIPEPSCCLGLWRIDKVDFMKAAVIPDKTLDEAAGAKYYDVYVLICSICTCNSHINPPLYACS